MRDRTTRWGAMLAPCLVALVAVLALSHLPTGVVGAVAAQHSSRVEQLQAGALLQRRLLAAASDDTTGDDHDDDPGDDHGDDHGDDSDDHGEEGDHGHGDHAEMSFTLKSTVVIFCIVGLVLITMCFETVKEMILEHSEGVLRPIADAVFSELTVLGFMGLVALFLEKGKFFDFLGKNIEKDVDHSHELHELFEEVHLTVFLVMLVYLFQVGLLMVVGKLAVRMWLAGRASFEQKEELMQELRKLERLELGHESKPNSVTPVLSVTKSIESVSHAVSVESFHTRLDKLRYMREYIAMRTQFISPSPSFPNILTAPSNFNLADYFCRRMGITLADVVHIPLWSWFFFLCLAFIFFGLERIMIKLGWEGKLGFLWLCFGYLTLSGAWFFKRKLTWIREQLIPKLLSDEDTNPTSEKESMEHEGCYKFGEPPYLSRELKYYGWFSGVPNQQQQLFGILGKHGPTVYLQMLRFVLLFNGLYVALFAVEFGEEVLNKFKLAGAIIITIVYMAPPVLLYLYMLPPVLRMYTVVTSIEMLKDPDTMKTTVAASRAHQAAAIVRIMLYIHTMNTHEEAAAARKADMESGPGEPPPPPRKTRSRRPREIKLTDMEERLFDTFDKDKSGTIDADEMGDMMLALGNKTPILDVMNILDSNGDGQVTKEEFAEWLHAQDLADVVPDELSEKFFDIAYDLDSKGVTKNANGKYKAMTESAFMATMLKFGAGLEKDEYVYLISEIEEVEPGETTEVTKVTKDKFTKYLSRHMRD